MPLRQNYQVCMRGYPFEPDWDCRPSRRVFRSILLLDCPNSRAVKITMSRIFEALKHGAVTRAGKTLTKSPVADVVEIPNRRRSRRKPMDIAVYVYGHEPGKEPFHEEAHTLKCECKRRLAAAERSSAEGTKVTAHQSADAAGAGLPRRFSGPGTAEPLRPASHFPERIRISGNCTRRLKISPPLELRSFEIQI